MPSERMCLACGEAISYPFNCYRCDEASGMSESRNYFRHREEIDETWDDVRLEFREIDYDY